MVFVVDKDVPWVGEDAVGEAHGGAVWWTVSWVPDGKLAGVNSLPSSRMEPGKRVTEPGLPAQFFLTVPVIFSPLTLLVWSPAKPSLTGIPPHNRKTWPCGALLVKCSERVGRSQGRILLWKSEDGHAPPLGTCCHPFDSNPNLLPGSQTPPDNAVKLWVLSRTEGKHAHSHSCSVYFTKVTEGCAVGVWSCRGEAWQEEWWILSKYREDWKYTEILKWRGGSWKRFLWDDWSEVQTDLPR